jgi:RNA polymerase sigma-70 factor (ECF subfamily)
MSVNLTDKTAFERYVVPEIDVLYRVARSLTRNAADAEDLVQDTLIRANNASDRFDGRYPRAWLLTILRNTHINRNRRRRPELLRDPDVTFERMSAAAGDDYTDDFIELKFDTEVADALAALPTRFRCVVELVDIKELSYAEAAEVSRTP